MDAAALAEDDQRAEAGDEVQSSPSRESSTDSSAGENSDDGEDVGAAEEEEEEDDDDDEERAEEHGGDGAQAVADSGLAATKAGNGAPAAAPSDQQGADAAIPSAKPKIIIKMKAKPHEDSDIAALMEGLSSDDEDEDGDNGDADNGESGKKSGAKRKKTNDLRGKKSFVDLVIKILYDRRRSTKGVSTQQLKKEMLNKYDCGSGRFTQHYQLTIKRMVKDKIIVKQGHRIKLDRKLQAKMRENENRLAREKKEADFQRRMDAGEVTLEELAEKERKAKRAAEKKEEARKKAQERRDAKAAERAKAKAELGGDDKDKEKKKPGRKKKSDKDATQVKRRKKKAVTPGLPKPPLPVMDLPFEPKIVQDLMAIAEFCSDFSHIVKLTPFSAEMLYKALTANDIVPLLRELHLVFLGLCLEPEMEQDEKVVRWDWFKMLNSLTWQEILRRYLVRSTALLGPEWPPYEDLVAAQRHLQTASYVTLSMPQKIAIIRALIDEVQSHPEMVEEVDRLAKELVQESTNLYHQDMSVRRQLTLVKMHQALLDQKLDTHYDEAFATGMGNAKNNSKSAPEGGDSDAEDAENDDENASNTKSTSNGRSVRGSKRKFKKMKTIEQLTKEASPITGAKLKERKTFFEERLKELTQEKSDIVVQHARHQYANFRLRAEAWGKDSKGNAFWTFRCDPGRLWIYGPGVRGEKQARENLPGSLTAQEKEEEAEFQRRLDAGEVTLEEMAQRERKAKEKKAKADAASPKSIDSPPPKKRRGRPPKNKAALPPVPTVDTKVETPLSPSRAEGAAVVPGASPTSRESLKTWRFYDTVEDIDRLAASLDPLSTRERHLKKTLTDFRDFIIVDMETEKDREAARKRAEEEAAKEKERLAKAEAETKAANAEPLGTENATNGESASAKDGGSNDNDNNTTPVEMDDFVEVRSRHRPKRNAAKVAEVQMRSSQMSKAAKQALAKEAEAKAPAKKKKGRRRLTKTWTDKEPEAFRKYRNLMNHVNGRELDIRDPDPEDSFLDDFDLKLFKNAERPDVTARVLKKDLGELAEFIETRGGKFDMENGKDDFVQQASDILSTMAAEGEADSEQANANENGAAENEEKKEGVKTEDGGQNAAEASVDSVTFDVASRKKLEHLCITLEQAATEAVIASKKQKVLDEAERLRQEKMREAIEKERAAQRVAMREARKRRNETRTTRAAGKRGRAAATRSGRRTRGSQVQKKQRRGEQMPEATLSGRIVKRVNYKEGASSDDNEEDEEEEEEEEEQVEMEEEEEEDIRAEDVDDEEEDDQMEEPSADAKGEAEGGKTTNTKVDAAEAAAKATEEEPNIEIKEDIEVSGAEAKRIEMMTHLERMFPDDLRVRCDLEPAEGDAAANGPSGSTLVNGKVKGFKPASYLSMDRVNDLWIIELENGETIDLNEKDTRTAYIRFRRYERDSNNVVEDDDEDDDVMMVDDKENEEERRRIRVLWGSKSERDAWLHTLEASETCSAWSSAIYQLANRIFVNNVLKDEDEVDDDEDEDEDDASGRSG
ncbi:Nucleosome-remodeling factor subunit NURF301 [Hondaea fermentalgiana]|uniref:Nucleosome-remodeling factor subunit NURF301 n=1 Tax=Hondaea fermentalgiana TaxID=2315210 RepID=A0A2R5GFT5_9STRA|nr:Nucleosome-remodeling factor subunit NURF301 [Hondaea fermentalgiana]|eukprot:GBG29435.1 Nucleosome-remodeling factor subunit NURF301 [Hondaea fermentalgiana]